MMLLLWIIGAYLCGAVPVSYIIAKMLRGIDIREHGSGNPGATNVFRVLGPVPGVAAFILDALKGFLPVFFAARYFGEAYAYCWLLVGLAAIAGHVWTVFLRFRGGKGVSTACGVFFALLPLPTLYAFILFFVVVLITRYVSLGSILAAAALPTLAFVTGAPRLLSLFAVVIAVMVIYRHKANIRRLLAGQENKIGVKKSNETRVEQ